jgi:hypothetical protein
VRFSCRTGGFSPIRQENSTASSVFLYSLLSYLADNIEYIFLLASGKVFAPYLGV